MNYSRNSGIRDSGRLCHRGGHMISKRVTDGRCQRSSLRGERPTDKERRSLPHPIRPPKQSLALRMSIPSGQLGVQLSGTAEVQQSSTHLPEPCTN